jgi:drug/metabolite transporter (DMT)-like permease
MTYQGPRYMMISALAFALMGSLVKLAGEVAIPLLQIIFIRALISAALSLWDLRRVGVNPLGHRRGLLLARGLSGFLALMGVFYALMHLPLAQATVLQYLHPVFTALLAFIFLLERPSAATVLCVLLSLVGLGCMVSPYWASTEPVGLSHVALLAGLGGALGSGVAYTLVRKLVATEHPSVIVLYFPLVCIPGTLLLGAADFIWPTATGWLILAGIGCFTQLGQVALTKAMQWDSASRATSLSYVQILFAAVLGWCFFDETPAFTTLLGSGFILLGAGINFWLQPARQLSH